MAQNKLNTIGRYRVRSRLGWGGMGEVYLAAAAGLEGVERPVAIKLIRELHQQREEFVSMFIEEAKVSFLLIHPNIVQTYEIGQVDGHYFLVMEYVDGITLEELLVDVRDRLGQPLPVPFALYIASQTARGLDHAHTLTDQEAQPLQIVHRDVSPSNVLLSRDGQVKLVDFGLAKSTLRRVQSQVGLVKGKLAYMAPEQLAGSADTGPPADIYSLGVVLYEMLSGRNPFGDLPNITPVSRHGHKAPPLSQVAPHLDPEVAQMVERCMMRDPSERFATVREVGRTLEAFQRRSDHAISSYELAEFIEKVGREASEKAPPPHPFDLALGVELQKVEGEDGGVSTFTRSAANQPALADTVPPESALPPLPRTWTRWLPWAVGAFLVGGLAAAGVFALRTGEQPHRSTPRDAGPDLFRPDARSRPDQPARTPATATLHVRPRPAGGQVRVAEQLRGTAPLTLSGLPAGEPIRVEIRKPGYLPYDQRVTLDPGGSLTIQPQLTSRPRARRRHGFLSVNSDPWSVVSINGRRIRNTPLVRHSLAAGTYRLRLYNPVRKLSKEQTVRIRPDRETRLSVELRR